MDEEFSSRHANVLFVVLTVINLFLLTTHLNVYIRLTKNVLFYLLNPTTVVAGHVLEYSQDISQTLHEIIHVHQDNLTLQKSLERYVYLDNDYQRMKEENTRLRELVNFPATTLGSYVVARVVSREPASWFQWVTINKGRVDDLKIDAPVLVWAGSRPAVLGRIVEVYDHSAKVVLITNTLSAMPVQIKGLGEDGLLEGQNNAGLKVNYLMSGGKMAIGDEVVTSPLSAVFPEGITVGHVEKITSSDNATMLIAEVRPVVNFNRLREVMILTAPQRKALHE
jgi:rod shape-determining protein MreC